jgi:hypothetical protein
MEKYDPNNDNIGYHKDLCKNLPDAYRLSNKNLIIISNVQEETYFFYDILDRNTTIILLNKSNSRTNKRRFIELCIDIGVTIIDLEECPSKNNNFELSNKTKNIITHLLTTEKFKNIYITPKFKLNPTNHKTIQNRKLHDFISYIAKKYNINNFKSHHTNKKCGIRSKILTSYRNNY